MMPVALFDDEADKAKKMAIQALEKQVPKEIVTKGQGHESDCYCPNCNAFLGSDQDWCFNQTKHCSECGQSLAEY